MSPQSPAQSAVNRLTQALLFIYLLVLIWVLLFKLGVNFSYVEQRSFNLIPFGASMISQGHLDFSEIILNVLIFIPLGVYTNQLFHRWSLGGQVWSMAGISLLFEGLQYLCRTGAFDITDVITNTTGGVLGLLIGTFLQKILGITLRAQQFINLIGVIGTTVIIILLILLRLNMLPIRYQ